MKTKDTTRDPGFYRWCYVDVGKRSPVLHIPATTNDGVSAVLLDGTELRLKITHEGLEVTARDGRVTVLPMTSNRIACKAEEY